MPSLDYTTSANVRGMLSDSTSDANDPTQRRDLMFRRLFHFRPTFIALFCILILNRAGSAENWPQWRGPRGDGSSLDKRAPLQWDGVTGKNIAWRSSVPGEGHSSPIVWGDRVFLTSCVTASTERILLCFHRDTGELIWQRTVFKGPLETIHALNSRASGTPATDGKFVYVAFMKTDGKLISAPNVSSPRDITSGEIAIAAFDYYGDKQWLVNAGEFISAHGFSSCPIIYDDLLILNGDHDGEKAFVVALDKTTGEERWRVKRENGIRSYVTPLIRTIAGRTQMVFSGSESIVSMNPRNGDTHWHVAGPTEQFVASMVFDGTLFYMNCGYPDHYVVAIRPDGTGDVTDQAIVWKSDKAKSYVPSPALVGEYLVVADDRGTANCFATKSGKRHWQERFGGGFSASLIHANGLVYLTGKDGVTSIVRPGPTLDVVAKNPLGETVSASPAISDGQLFLRGEKSLFCVVEHSQNGEPK